MQEFHQYLEHSLPPCPQIQEDQEQESQLQCMLKDHGIPQVANFELVGCPPGVIDSNSGLEGCNSQISLFIPQVYALKQRSFMLGAISSTDANEKDQFFPILFDSVLCPWELHWIPGLQSTSYYNYSMIELATAIRNRNLPSKALTLLRQLFLKYPGLVDRQDSLVQLNHLCVNLLVHEHISFRQPSNKYNSSIAIYKEVLSLGSLFALRPEGKKLNKK